MMPDAPRIAIVGASVRAAVESARRAGFDAMAADLFADADLADLCPVTRIEDYPEGFAPWLREQSVDGWIYTGGLENCPDLVDRMAPIAPLWGVSGTLLRKVRDPRWLAEACCKGGVDFPETLPIGNGADSPTGWLAKTYRHSSGAGVWKLTDRVGQERSHAEQACWQRFVPGRTLSAQWVLPTQGPELLGVTEQLVGGGSSELAGATSAAPWQYSGSIFLPHHRPHWDVQLTKIGQWLHTIGLRGLVGVDLIDDGKQLWLLEINPRYTAAVEVIERSTGRAAFAGWFHLSRRSSMVLTDWVWGKVVLFARRKTTVSERFAHWLAGQHAKGLAADLPCVGTKIEIGQPVVTLFASTSRDPLSGDRLARMLAESLAQSKRQFYGHDSSSNGLAHATGHSERHSRIDRGHPPGGPHVRKP